MRSGHGPRGQDGLVYLGNAAKITSHSNKWGCSSAGRAPRSQRGGHRFDPGQLHQAEIDKLQLLLRRDLIQRGKKRLRGTRRCHVAAKNRLQRGVRSIKVADGLVVGADLGPFEVGTRISTTR
jgi:hypothetical protein